MWIPGTVSSSQATRFGTRRHCIYTMAWASMTCYLTNTGVRRWNARMTWTGFPEPCFNNRIPPSFAVFVNAEVQALVDSGRVVKCTDVRGPGRAPRPRLVMALSVEESEPHLIYDARPLNK